MKMIFTLVSALLAAELAFAGPQLNFASWTPNPTNVIETAVHAPIGLWPKATVYNPQAAASAPSSLGLVWDATTNNTGYVVYYGDITDNKTNRLVLSTNTSLIMFGLSTNTTYWFFVTATNMWMLYESAPSNLMIYRPLPQ